MGGTGKTGGTPGGGRGGGVGIPAMGAGTASGGAWGCTSVSTDVSGAESVTTSLATSLEALETTSGDRDALFRSVGHTAAFASSDAKSSNLSTMLRTCSNGSRLSQDSLRSLSSALQESFAPSDTVVATPDVVVDVDALAIDD